VKKYQKYAKYLAIAIVSIAVGAILIIRLGVYSQSRATTPAPTSASSDVGLHEARERMPPVNESAIAMQSAGTVLRRGGDGLNFHEVIAHCAKDYVLRGSMCEMASVGK
jgi:hypothetical protein